MRQLDGQVAVVTGAARGIGKCIAARLAGEGARTVILDFDEEAGALTEKELRGQGLEVLFVKTDVGSYASLEAAKDKTIEKYLKTDILVINAGISHRLRVEDITVEEWNRVLHINLNGSFYTVKAYYGEFLKKNGNNPGKIVFISSGSAITGTGGGCHYAASKAGQNGLMRAIAKELGPRGVNVNAIAPRVIMTDIFDHLYPTEESRKELLEKIPIGRFGLPGDVAEMVRFLVSPEASYVHGQIVLVDGGRTY
ncbi:MAG: SDR family oxidoreductase [Treponema sp.]|jgi:3-oxoacyl-[acyl-carrier protein] reductase|nr:SDR family oxidoreductase [Treponema sp.]